jgi:hypothetical protein
VIVRASVSAVVGKTVVSKVRLGSVVSLVLYVVVGTVCVFGCAKPGPVRSKAMNVTNTDQSNDPGMAAAELEESNKRSGVKYTK